MCLAVMAIDPNRRFSLVVASNRDEYFDRPAAPLDWWRRAADEAPILSGRDLVSGGTWLGLSARGLLAADFSSGDCFWASNQGTPPRRLTKGVYALSNASLNTPWPKVQALKARLRTALAAATSADALAQHLFDALADRTVAPDATLPRTGVPLTWERRLSAAFITSPDRRYGTRCSTLIITERSAGAPVTQLWERSFDADGNVLATRRSWLRAWPQTHDDPRIDFQMRDALVTDF